MLDGAAQASLGEGLVNQGLRSLLTMSRLCRVNVHPWRLQQVWVRINQLEQELGDSINVDSRKALEEERAFSMPLIAPLVPAVPAPSRVDLQPSQAAVKVSAPHGEVGRARFYLTNESVRTVRGTLEVAAKTGTLKKWESGSSGHWLTLGAPATVPEGATAPPATAPPSKKAVSLRPGERISVYVEREQPSVPDTVNLTWTAPGGTSSAKSEFAFATRVPQTSVVNSGSFTARPGWSVPLYHELNYRGPGLKAEDFQFQANVPCRLEIFDVDGGRHPSVDAGRLLAVDAEGDGYFTGGDDHIEADANADGNPDVVIGDRSRSLEIFAWPLVPLPQDAEIVISARLLQPGQPSQWRTDAENTIEPLKKPVPAEPSKRERKSTAEPSLGKRTKSR